MNVQMEKANMLAKGMNEFIAFVYKHLKNKHSSLINLDKLYHIKLLIEEHKLQILADELKRINQFTWDEKYSYYLINQFNKALTIIDDYVAIYENDLYMLTGRLYTLKNLVLMFEKTEESKV
jgi:hypothetical protein